ncbi:MAG TPA: fused MFS/spermidine synthase [Burkholderiales bacterium]|nr:fused MFS/spermidine synthase [Burkholderiales bacterium]
MLLYAVIFVSGGAILALELLASRIMMPYFGVSLYIWTGILSITLVALAIGYWLGGVLAARRSAEVTPGRLLQLYALMPALAGLALVAACFAYPQAFATLAAGSLLAGAFAACLVLLFVPLVAASAMNPLLVAILVRRQHTGGIGDAGAGRVFFVSTVGSVAGVIVTAFAIIPHMSNFTAVLGIAIVLASLAIALVAFARERVAGKPLVTATATGAIALGALLLWNADGHTGRAGAFAYAGTTWRVEAAYSSLFGTVKVLRQVTSEPQFLRMYFHDGLTQNTADSAGRSTSFYTYALEALARAYSPGLRSALVLGLGAGMVPMALARSGVSTAVVDIDPNAPRAARTYFGFDPSAVRTHLTDARTFVRRCDGGYDVVIVDLFHGDGTPDYLVTRDFFADLKRCLGARGVAVFNTFADLDRPQAYAHVLATIRSELPHLALHRPPSHGPHVNSFVVASAHPLAAPAKVTLSYLPPRHADTLWTMLSAPAPLTPELATGGTVVTDAVNRAAHDFAQTQMIYRKTVVRDAPAALLVN